MTLPITHGRTTPHRAQSNAGWKAIYVQWRINAKPAITQFHTCMHTHTLSLFLSHTHTHTYTLSLSHTHTHAHSSTVRFARVIQSLQKIHQSTQIVGAKSKSLQMYTSHKSHLRGQNICKTLTKHSKSQMQIICGQRQPQYFTQLSPKIIHASRAWESCKGLQQAQCPVAYRVCTKRMSQKNWNTEKQRNAKITVFYWSVSKGLVIIP